MVLTGWQKFAYEICAPAALTGALLGGPVLLAMVLDIATGGSSSLSNSLYYCSQHGMVARVQNTTAMSLLCRDIIPLDAVTNISVAETCSEWCHEALGPNSAVPYMLSWGHVLGVLASEQSIRHVYLTCWKAQTAAMALELMPEWYSVYLLAMVYGLWSIIAFLWTFWNTEPQTVPGGPAQNHVTPDGPYGRICGDIPCCCLPIRCNQALPLENGWNEAPLCYPVSSDRNGSEIGLKVAAFFIWFEPFGDIVSILTLLRIGQPFPAAFMAFGIALPCAIARDPLQLSGARAVAESLRKGFETRALLQYRDHEWWESVVCATVQFYTLMSLHPKAIKLSAGLNLLVSASLNLAISIPAQDQASHVIRELKDSDWTFAKIQEAKRSPRVQSRKQSLVWSILAFAVFSSTMLSYIIYVKGSINVEKSRNLDELPLFWLRLFWFRDGLDTLWSILFEPETWQQLLLALLLICFRLSCICIVVIPIVFLMIVGPLYVCCFRPRYICCFPAHGRSNSQTDRLPLLDTESPPISARFSCLKSEDSQSSEE